MSEQILNKFEELIESGNKLTPLGGFEFSGYNARLQPKYLEWRKSVLTILEASGPIGFPYKQKILSDSKGEYFFQSSAQLILNCVRELYDKLKASPELANPPQIHEHEIDISGLPPPNVVEKGGVRVLKPPPKRQTPGIEQSQQVVNPTAVPDKVYVIGERDDPLYAQLLQFLNEIGLKEVVMIRQHGQMLGLDAVQIDKSVKYAFFVINASDLSYAMFEIGHFVGKLGKNCVCVLHMSDVDFPRNIPGVLIKPIVVKLEEASLGILKELKAAGYKLDL
jgi:hypothetical protein